MRLYNGHGMTMTGCLQLYQCSGADSPWSTLANITNTICCQCPTRPLMPTLDQHVYLDIVKKHLACVLDTGYAIPLYSAIILELPQPQCTIDLGNDLAHKQPDL